MEQKEKSPSGKKGTCSNCGREKYIADKDGHCGTCHTAVKGIDPGSVAYVSALDKIKDRTNTPGFKTRPAKQKKSNCSKPAIEQSMSHTRSLAVGRDGGDSGTSRIMATLQIERENLLARVKRIDQAISLFS